LKQSLRKEIRARARDRCEYCQLHQDETSLPHEVDHVRARKHHGASLKENLCMACAYCNAAKGPNVAGYDPLTDELVPLFNPRIDEWQEHFRWKGAFLEGRTAVARATIEVLRINSPERVEHRSLLG
jgi:5-methylcytosine-specific restriction endonuclease McrA